MDRVINDTDFFVVGGTLLPDAQSYVTRPADDELFNLVRRGTVCYVLTPRQMGKSSLMIRTAIRLEKEGVSTAIIDLSLIGTLPIEQWYLGLLSELKPLWPFTKDFSAWWEAQKRATPGHSQRFRDFLRDVLLKEIEGPIVIFIDEIDKTLDLDFSDDFFVAIRAIHNARAHNPEFRRLTFVLLGVISPPDLIKSRTITPFNIGQGISLEEFSQAKAIVLQEGLEAVYEGQGKAIFDRIYHWTSGYPYLMQKLCFEIAEHEQKDQKDWTNEQIDALVGKLFLSKKAVSEEPHLQFIQDRILKSPQRRKLLNLYSKIYQKDKKVPEDKQSIIQNQLKLSGLVKAENGSLSVRNPIYRHVFDLQWVKEHTAIDWVRILAVVASLVAILAISLIALESWQAIQINSAISAFSQTDDSQERIAHLAQILTTDRFLFPTDKEQTAHELFYRLLPKEKQLEMFKVQDFKPRNVSDSDLIIVIKALYVKLAYVEPPDKNIELLQQLEQAFNHIQQTEEAENLKNEISNWVEARQQAKQNLFTSALSSYSTAIPFNMDNPATLYERARVQTWLSNYPEALADLDEVVRIVREGEPATPISTVAALSTATNTPTISPTATNTPTVSPTLRASSTPTPSEQVTTGPAEPTVTSAPPVILSPIPTNTATPTATPTPTPQLFSFTSEFVTFGEINAIRVLLDRNPALGSYLANAQSETLNPYPNLLREASLQPTVTPTPAPTRTPFPTSTPFSVVTSNVSTIQRIRDRGNVLIAAVKYDIPPFGFLDENGQVVGFEVDLIQAMADEWGVEVQFAQVTSSNRISKLAGGEVDIVAASMTHRKERDETIDFSQTYFLDGQSLLVQGDSGIEGIQNLDGKRVASIEGSTSIQQIQAYADANDVSIEILPFQEYPPALEALKAGVVDALTSDSGLLSQSAKDNPELTVVGGLFTEEPYGMGLPAGDSYFNNLVDFTLQNIQTNGTYDKIYQKWFGEDSFPYPIEILPGQWPYTFANSPSTLDKPVQSKVDEKILTEQCGFVAGVKNDFPPFGFIENQEVVGFDVDIVKEFAKRWCGDQNAVELAAVTSSNRIEKLAQGQVDLLAASMTHKRERDETIDFSQTYFFDQQRLLVQQNSPITDVISLDGKVVAAIQGSTSINNIQAEADKLGIIIQIVPFLEYFTALNALKAGQVDTLTTDGGALLYFAQQNPELKVVGELFTNEPYGLGLPNYDDRFRDLVNFTLQEMKVDGTYDRLYEKWFGDERPYAVEIWPGKSHLLLNTTPMFRIPAGEFIRGSNNGLPNETPERVIFLDEFYIDQYEVTNRLYEQCVRANSCSAPQLPSSTSFVDYYASPAFGNYPVVWVTWEDAQRYDTGSSGISSMLAFDW